MFEENKPEIEQADKTDKPQKYTFVDDTTETVPLTPQEPNQIKINHVINLKK